MVKRTNLTVKKEAFIQIPVSVYRSLWNLENRNEKDLMLYLLDAISTGRRTSIYDILEDGFLTKSGFDRALRELIKKDYIKKDGHEYIVNLDVLDDHPEYAFSWKRWHSQSRFNQNIDK